jgi:upstream activation factor subunit UAF30
MPVKKTKAGTKKKAAPKRKPVKKAATTKKTTVRKTAAKRKPAAKKKAAPKRKVAKKAAPKKKATARKAAPKRKPAARKAAPKKKPAARKAAPKRKPAAKTKTKRKPNAAFMKPMMPSAKLAMVVGGKALPRTEVTKKLWMYIKKLGLQDPKKRTMINADAALKAVFNGRKQVSMFEMTKLVSKHLKDA